MKKLFVIFLLFFMLPANAAVLTGEVEYSVNDARVELQNNRPSSLDFLFTKNNFIDDNYAQNYSALLKGITKLKDRTLAIFSDGSYGIIYNNDPMHVWYYNKGGELINAEVKTGTKYPYKTYKYSPEGELVNMTLRVSLNETFIFSPIGKLIGHWVGQNCYDESGRIIMTRKVLK